METIACIYILSGIISTIIVFSDIYVRKNHQTMKIMNIVWILTVLWAGIIGLCAYYSFGRARHHSMEMSPMKMEMKMGMKMNKPQWQRTALSTLHCGAGCSLADFIGEWFLFFVPMSLVWGWTLDYIMALLIGVFFQYIVISRMEKISGKEAYSKAFKADFWSLTSWQIGMYGFISILIFGFDYQIDRLTWEFWFLMQIAMMCGFLVSYPMNSLLITMGIKKGM